MLYILSDYINYIIVGAAVFEALLYITLYRTLHVQSIALKDCLHNVMRGSTSCPSFDSRQTLLEQAAGLTNALKHVLAHNTADKAKVIANLQQNYARKLHIKTQKLQVRNNVAVALVGIFVLLGLIGTISAIGQSVTTTDTTGGIAQAEAIVASLIVAVDSTLLGLFFSVLFSLINARWQGAFRTFTREVETYQNLFENYVACLDSADYKNKGR